MANNSYIYTVGSTTTVSFDLKKNQIDLWIEESSRDLHACWHEEFCNHPSVTVMLSGGLDSQFSALLAKKHCVDVDAVIFEFVWDKTVINAHDVLAARRFADLHNIPALNVEIDVKDCLSNDLDRICKNYICISPQVAVHVRCVEKLIASWDHSKTLLMGGEVPLVAGNNGLVVMPSYRSKDLNIVRESVNVPFAKSLLPFCMLSAEHNINIIRDPLCMTPEIFFLAHCHNAAVFQHKGKVIDAGDLLRTEITDYKLAYYELLVDGLMPQMLKRTGFELLRYWMAVHSGVYNQFDKTYRARAIQNVLGSRKQHGRSIASVTNFPFVHGPIQKVAEVCAKSLETHKPSACNIYKFDW